MEQVDIICVHDNDAFSAPIEYTFGLLLSTLGIRYRVLPLHRLVQEGRESGNPLFITYTRDPVDLGPAKRIHICASDFFGPNYLRPDSLPRTPLERYDDLPAIYLGHGPPGLVRQSGGLVETGIDLIASSFFMVSRYEEVVLHAKDEHDRFPAAASLAYKEGFLSRPVVNEYIELLWRWVHSLQPGLVRRPLWPDNRSFAVCLTHDVDSFRKYPPLTMLLSVAARLRHGRTREALDLAAQHLKTLAGLAKDPFDTFDYMVRLEQSLGFKSSFYVKAGCNSEYDSEDTVRRTRGRRLAKRLEQAGCEVGLHPSYNSYDRPEYMRSEKAALDRVVGNPSYGCRQHYLRWRTPDTWRLQEQAGLLYDSTLSFADHAGFRCGVCLPFRPFDVIENRTLDIWELPLTVQEGTLQRPGYQGLCPAEAYQTMVELLQVANRSHGVFVLLWHNSSFDARGRWAGWREVYESLMGYVSEQDAWVTGGREIIQWWKDR